MGARKELVIKSRNKTEAEVRLAWGPFELFVYLNDKFYVMKLITSVSHDSGIRYTGYNKGKDLTPQNISDWFYDEYLLNKKKDIIKSTFRGNYPVVEYPDRW